MQCYSYNDGLLQSTDWMAISILFDDDLPKSAPPNHIWVVNEHGTNVWNHHACLFNEYGEKVLTLLAKPKAEGFLQSRAGLVEVANEWLYHGIGVGGALDLLHWCCPFSVTGISRLDLCMDFCPDLNQRDVIKGLAEGRYYVSGKRSGSGFWSVCNEPWVPAMWQGKCPHCQSWGHKTTQVKWKLYYKSKELRDAGGGWFAKPYIVDGWRKFGLDENNVWRLEVSMKDCNTLVYGNGAISYSAWAAHELEIFTGMYCGRFQVRANQGHKDKSNDDAVMFLPISTIGRVRCKKYEGDDVRSSRVSLLRSLVKYAATEEVYMDIASRKALSQHVESIVMNDNLTDYFKAMTGKTLGQWTKELVELREGNIRRINQLPKNTDINPNTKFDL